jgi:hypothetical protein
VDTSVATFTHNLVDFYTNDQLTPRHCTPRPAAAQGHVARGRPALAQRHTLSMGGTSLPPPCPPPPQRLLRPPRGTPTAAAGAWSAVFQRSRGKPPWSWNFSCNVRRCVTITKPESLSYVLLYATMAATHCLFVAAPMPPGPLQHAQLEPEATHRVGNYRRHA